MMGRLLIVLLLAIAATFLGMAFVVASRGYGLPVTQSILALLTLFLLFTMAAGVIWRRLR